MNNPKVSVIIPNYNHARYLDQRIQSVLNQTYQNFEVIILDDCSTDNSMEVINKYKGNPHISNIVVNEENSGSTFKQWDKGIQLAKGEIIWIAESDDYCKQIFLEVLMALWERFPNYSIIQSASCLIDDDGRILYPEICFSGKEEVFSGKEAIQKHLLCSNFYIPNASAVTFKKEYALSIAKDYMDYKASGDRLFWICMLEKGSLCKIDLPLNLFRQHEINKVSQRCELDGTQCSENFFINKYLHKKGYVKGKLRDKEITFYWEYIHDFPFDNEKVRRFLLDLWFPGIKQKTFVYKILRKYYAIVK